MNVFCLLLVRLATNINAFSGRICKLCKHYIEDEIHFVCVFPELNCGGLKYSNLLNRKESPSLIHKCMEIASNAT